MPEPGAAAVEAMPAGMAEAAFDAQPHATAILDRRGVIVAVNRAWRRFAIENGAPSIIDAACGPGADYLAVCAAATGEGAEGADLAAAGILRLLQGDEGSVELEYPCHAPGAPRWFVMSAHPLPAPGTGVVVMHVDVTRRKLEEEQRVRSEIARQAIEARYRGVLEDQTECISRFSADGTILYVNPAYCRFFGRRAEDLIGRRWHPVAHPDDVPMIEAELALMSAQNPLVGIENRVHAGDGSLRWMHFVNHGFYSATGSLLEIQSVGRDITERVQADERQRQLLAENSRLGSELIRLQEVERTRLAQEMHDDLSQQLVAIRAYAGAIRRNGGDPQRNVANARAIEAAVGEIYDASHRIMEGLHPQVLDSAGLYAALCLMLTRWSLAHTEVRAWLRVAGDIDPGDGGIRIHLFRIVQECLANVAAHAGASRVRLFLAGRRQASGRVLSLVVRDDGKRLDLDSLHAGYGLIVLRERVRTLGGRLDLLSPPGGGFRVCAVIPLPPRATGNRGFTA